MTTYPQKISFAEMRASGVRDVLVYCRDHRCSHHIEIGADRWSDHVRIQGLWASGCRCEAAIELARIGTVAQRNGPSVGTSWGRRLGG